MTMYLASPTLGQNTGASSYAVPIRERAVWRARQEPAPKTKRAPRYLLEEPASLISYDFQFVRRKLRAASGGLAVRSARSLRLGLFRRRWRSRFLLGCFTAASAEQRQGIPGAKGEAANGLFPGGAQGDVDAPVIGQPHGQQVFQDLLLFRRAQVRFGFDQFLHLFGGHVLFKAKRLGFEMVRGYALLHQVALGAFHAPFRKLHVVVFGSANVRVAFESQVRVRPVCQILFK